MKLWKKILICAIVIVVAAAVGLCIWQRENLTAVYTVLTSDSESIAAELDKTREESQQALSERVELNVSPIDTEQSNAILSGSKTADEVKEELGITAQLDLSGSEETAEELINTCVAELYACQVDIMETLSALKQEALDEWYALSPEERTSTKKKEIGLAGLNKCYALEAAVDDQVREILERYRARLDAMDADDGVLDDLWDYYSKEKAAEKAYYLDKYMN